MYVCGPAGSVPVDIRRAVRQCLMQEGHMTEEAADKLIVAMIIDRDITSKHGERIAEL